MTTKDYLFNDKLDSTATITAIGQENEQNWIYLDRTMFHPQGGGQKADRGTIQDIPVTQVIHADGDVKHYLESTENLQVGQQVSICVDGEWRLANSKLHTAGHLIAGIVEQKFPDIKPTTAHHWAGESRVEFTSDNLPTPAAIESYLPTALQQAIHNDLPVAILGTPITSRSIQIGTLKAVACGGTHLHNLGQLEIVEITGVKIKKGKLRISYQTTAK